MSINNRNIHPRYISLAIILVRGKKDITAEVLEEIVKAPNIAPSRVFARASVSYMFMKVLLQNDLLKLEKTGKRRARISITEKGHTFLQHYRICNKLLPS